MSLPCRCHPAEIPFHAAARVAARSEVEMEHVQASQISTRSKTRPIGPAFRPHSPGRAKSGSALSKRDPSAPCAWAPRNDPARTPPLALQEGAARQAVARRARACCPHEEATPNARLCELFELYEASVIMLIILLVQLILGCAIVRFIRGWANCSNHSRLGKSS